MKPTNSDIENAKLYICMIESWKVKEDLDRKINCIAQAFAGFKAEAVLGCIQILDNYPDIKVDDLARIKNEIYEKFKGYFMNEDENMDSQANKLEIAKELNEYFKKIAKEISLPYNDGDTIRSVSFEYGIWQALRDAYHKGFKDRERKNANR